MNFSEGFKQSIFMFFYLLLDLLSLGWFQNTRWGALMINAEALEALDWAESQDLEGKVCYIDDGDHRHHWTDTEPRHISFWRDEGEWKGGVYEGDNGDIISLLGTVVPCKYLDQKRRDVLDDLKEKSEPWWNVINNYDEEIPVWARVIKKPKFKELSKAGILSDSRGFGLLVKDGKMSTSYKVTPSQVDKLAEDATHVAWMPRIDSDIT